MREKRREEKKREEEKKKKKKKKKKKEEEGRRKKKKIRKRKGMEIMDGVTPRFPGCLVDNPSTRIIPVSHVMRPIQE